MKQVNGKETLIFVHIPKAAGTTLAHLIEPEFEHDEIYVTNPVECEVDFHRLPQSEKADIRLVSGHMSFGLHPTLSRPFAYVTMLRNPVKRVISHYFFEQREPLSSIRSLMEAGMTLAEFVHHQQRYKRDNLQTRVLADDWVKRHGTRPCDEEMLEQAKDNLTEHFAVVGLAEQFAESYLLMANLFGWRPRLSVRHNRMGGGGEVIPAGDIALITEHNQYDLQLYAFAKELLTNQLAQQPLAFHRQLNWYKRRSRLNDWYWTLRQYSLRTYLKQLVTK